ncbi:hypothetical protein [Telmatospirillum sp. J64-1]|uniref:hypothetical protein n=1 Tax=Telmatospirillum sp. J64-1 TaxID=2502183 RepID=UPI00115EC462|nr:hypothetical protein [Telmatospirillum sp. J64-1]
MKIRAVGGAETDNAALGHGIGELIEIRRIGLNDHGFVRTARKVVEYIERGMAPYSNDSPYRTWLAEAGRQANAGDLSQVRLDAWNQVQAAFARRTRERFDALDAYVASVENGARPQGRLTEELRDLSGNPIFAPLYERFEAARGSRRQLQRARAIRLIEALENGGSSMFDPSMYATLNRSSPDGQGMYVDLLPRFQAAVASCSALRPNYRRKKG